MISNFHRVLDPLDVEILERAVDQAWAAFKDCEIKSDCDQALEAALHRELIEIAKLYGVTESDTLRRLARIGIRREPFLSIARIRPSDGEALMERFLALAGDRDLCVSLGTRARVAFERQWDKEKALAEWEALLQAVGHPIAASNQGTQRIN